MNEVRHVENIYEHYVPKLDQCNPVENVNVVKMQIIVNLKK